jgi:parallel beta-helix repeat protein
MPNNKLWEKGLVVSIIVLFIGTNFVSGLNIQLKNTTYLLNSDNGNTLYVGGSGPGNYSRIQAAINDANPGDTVFVYNDSSPYNENVVVNKTINLIGEDRDTTVIYGDCVVIFSNVVISGFTITDGSGIVVFSDNNIIKNNKIIFCTNGVEFYDNADFNTITNNIIIHNEHNGIYDDSRESGNTITWNVIGDNANCNPNYPYFFGLYKHRGGGYYHHNDFYMNRAHAYNGGYSSEGIWDDGSEGNYWDDWESNPGYPDVYIIHGFGEDGIDRYPSSTPYFDYTIVKINYLCYGRVNELIYFFPSINVDPSSVSWFWEFGDGTTSNEIYPEHSYNKSGIYPIRVTVTDNKNKIDTDRAKAIIGLPPNQPSIEGPTHGTAGVVYNYTFNTTDPDGDDVYYVIVIENVIGTFGPYHSGEGITFSWSWPKGTHIISAFAKDIIGLKSPVTTLEITMPRTTTYNSLLLKLLEKHLLLERLLLML